MPDSKIVDSNDTEFWQLSFYADGLPIRNQEVEIFIFYHLWHEAVP